MRILRLSLLAALLPFAAPGAADADHSWRSPPFWRQPMIRLVREATARFNDVDVATAEGYVPFLGCVSGRSEGAMGIHYLNGALVGDGALDPNRPEVLIYEPLPGGRMRLVGVEYLTFADAWHASSDTPPVLGGHVFHYSGSPNRYSVPAHYELHVWAWQPNPRGTFADWNPLVSCDAYDPAGV